MAKPIKVDFTKTEDTGYYVSPGAYQVKCTKVTQEEGAKAPYLQFDFAVVGSSVVLRRRCTLKPDALFSLKNTLSALMGKEIPRSVISIDPDKLVGRVAKAIVADREYDGKTYSDITRMEAYSEIARTVSSPSTPTTVAGGTPTDDLEEL